VSNNSQTTSGLKKFPQTVTRGLGAGSRKRSGQDVVDVVTSDFRNCLAKCYGSLEKNHSITNRNVAAFCFGRKTL